MLSTNMHSMESAMPAIMPRISTFSFILIPGWKNCSNLKMGMVFSRSTNTSFFSIVFISDGRIFNISRTPLSGITYLFVPAAITSACIMAMVIGTVRIILTPFPSAVSISTVPLNRAIFSLTTSMPTPLPEIPLTSSFVENPGINMNSSRLCLDRVWEDGSSVSPLSTAFLLTASTSIPLPSSATSMTT